RYAHSDGRVQTKDELLTAVAKNPVSYLSVVPHDVAFQTLAPGAVAMTGRTEIIAQAGRERTRFALRFLSVWREEAGRWRLAAYQSSQLLAPATPAPNSEVAP
ncbi:MAG TPA: nuclear transport factor 2 family protein, partial [Opitutus sp.]|nr:nuclear transport factor 2 family protein [Opitutus sp.]